MAKETGTIIITVTTTGKQGHLVLKSDDFSPAETATNLFFALMSAYDIHDEKEIDKIHDALCAIIKPFVRENRDEKGVKE